VIKTSYREFGKSLWYYNKEAVKAFNKGKGNIIACMSNEYAKYLVSLGIQKDKIWIGENND